MSAKGCKGRGGNANGKKNEGRRHGGGGSGKGKRRRASASRVEKAHETVERRAGKKEATEYDPDSIMGIMNNIKSLSDEIKGGA